MEDHARSASHITSMLHDVIHKRYATYSIPGVRLVLLIMFSFLGSTRSMRVGDQQSKQWLTDWAT